jgi:hypothetical protein
MHLAVSLVNKVMMVEPLPETQFNRLKLGRRVKLRYKDMHDIRRFFVHSMQRSHSVILESVKLLREEFQKRLGHQEIISDSDNLLYQSSADYLKEQFVVVRNEEDMVETMRRSVELNEEPFDIIISPFGCDPNSLPPRLKKLLGCDEEEDIALPSNLTERMLDVSSTATTPAAPETVAEQKMLERGHHMCRKVTAALQKELSRGLASSSSSSVEPDFTSASAPVIVYSPPENVALVALNSRREIAFMCVQNFSLFFLITCKLCASGTGLQVCDCLRVCSCFLTCVDVEAHKCV